MDQSTSRSETPALPVLAELDIGSIAYQSGRFSVSSDTYPSRSGVTTRSEREDDNVDIEPSPSHSLQNMASFQEEVSL